MRGFMVVKLTSTPAGGLVRMLGNTGAPVCVGERLTLTWLEVGDGRWFPCGQKRVGQRAQRHAVVENSPKLPRTTVRRDANGDQAKPARGEKLLVSVAMDFRNCRS